MPTLDNHRNLHVLSNNEDQTKFEPFKVIKKSNVNEMKNGGYKCKCRAKQKNKKHTII